MALKLAREYWRCQILVVLGIHVEQVITWQRESSAGEDTLKKKEGNK